MQGFMDYDCGKLLVSRNGDRWA